MNSSLPSDYIFQLAAPISSASDDIDVLFAARASGLYYSRDDGRSWSSAYASLSVERPLPTMAVVLASDFKHEPHIFAGLNGAILRSYDGGTSWQQCVLPAPPPVISSLVASPQYSTDGIVFAGTNEDGVLVSSDRGIHWVPWNFGLLDLNILCLAISPDFATDETLYAGVESGLFRSTNGGRAWREVALPVGYDAVLSLAISPNFAQDHTLFAGTENKGLLISQDWGKTWRGFTETPADQPINSILISPGFPVDPALLILHGDKLIITRDNGTTWNPWQTEKLEGRSISAVLARRDFEMGVLAGLEDGSVIRI